METFFNRLGGLGAVFTMGGFFVSRFVFVVDGGERALVMDATRGLLPGVYGEGVHLMIPGIQKVVKFEIRSMPKLFPTQTITGDQQGCDIALRVLYRPIPEGLPQIYDNLGLDYADRILPSVSQEVLKSVVAQYNAEQLISQREKVSREIQETLAKRAHEFNIVLDDVSITDLSFAAEFRASIEQKQVAQQQAEMHKYLVQKREEEAKAQVIRAEGDGIAAELVANATLEYGSALVTLRKLEAAKEIAKELQSSPNVTFLSGNTLNMLNIPAGAGRSGMGL